MKAIGSYVSQKEAGQRLAQVTELFINSRSRSRSRRRRSFRSRRRIRIRSRSRCSRSRRRRRSRSRGCSSRRSSIVVVYQ